MMHHFRPRRAAGPLRACALARPALALAGCEAQPVGTFKNAAFVADGGRAASALDFQPGSAALRPRRGGAASAFLGGQLLGPPTTSWCASARPARRSSTPGGRARCARLPDPGPGAMVGSTARSAPTAADAALVQVIAAATGCVVSARATRPPAGS